MNHIIFNYPMTPYNQEKHKHCNNMGHKATFKTSEVVIKLKNLYSNYPYFYEKAAVALREFNDTGT